MRTFLYRLTGKAKMVADKFQVVVEPVYKASPDWLKRLGHGSWNSLKRVLTGTTNMIQRTIQSEFTPRARQSVRVTSISSGIKTLLMCMKNFFRWSKIGKKSKREYFQKSCQIFVAFLSKSALCLIWCCDTFDFILRSILWCAILESLNAKINLFLCNFIFNVWIFIWIKCWPF